VWLHRLQRGGLMFLEAAHRDLPRSLYHGNLRHSRHQPSSPARGSLASAELLPNCRGTIRWSGTAQSKAQHFVGRRLLPLSR